MFDSKIRAQIVIFYVKFEYILVYRPSFRHNIELYMQNHDIRALTTFENSPRIYERFVDTSLKRKPDGTISVLVYRKPTHTDQYLNYYSNHQAKTKDAVVSALFRRAKDIISDKDDLEKENNKKAYICKTQDQVFILL